jgi:two-component system chemotaxis sensor kinase CheA
MAARLIEEQRRIIMLPGDDATLASRLTAVSFTLGTLLTSLDWLDHQEALAAATDRESLIAVIDLLLQRAAPTLGAPSVAPVVAPVAGSGPAAIAIPAVSADGRKPLPRMLRVDQDKVDALMTLIAELVVSKNSLPFLARRAEDVYGSRDMSREIKDQYSVIDRLAQEMQRAILDIRMLPVSEVFERFPRLVRDLSRKLEKQITLKVIGEETAADKNIIEALGDPLIHLVRNSIDHGIESPEQRAAAGKPEAATIQLRAWQEGDQVIIEVSDDGKGIDPAIVKAKALEKGLITVEKAHSMTDQDAINLIFLPGFSTAASISDLSGRGVGMDVVRTAIEKINGHVTLSSELGAGTLIRLSLPLSMAVSRVMMIEIGDGLFGVPMDIIVETVKIPRSLIRSIKRAEAFVLRNAIIPLLRLRSLLELAPREGVAEEEAVLVVRVANSTVGLVVDRFREGIDVIQKPMDGLLAGMRGYSGSALLGDGRVLLVLNLKELL